MLASGYHGERGSQDLDLKTILKAATAISEEVQLDRLLKKLVRIAGENAGARHGYLILKKENGLFIEAEGSIDVDQEINLQSVPVTGNGSISEAIVQFVAFTKENLVVGNASAHPHFSLDPNIVKKSARSVLCIPIVHLGNLTGLLYLENDLIMDAFTPDRIEILKLLSGLMAVSLQNALLKQEEQEQFRTKLEIQEQILRDISSGIHDDTNQKLTFIKLSVNAVLKKSDAETKIKLEKTAKIISEVIQSLRNLSRILDPDYIFRMGLTGIINEQLQFLNSDGYTAGLVITGDEYRYSPDTELTIFRVIQGLLTNVVKHANATVIDIAMDYQPGLLLITVKDNGVGFDIQKAEVPGNKGLGIHTMYKRITLIRGKIFIKSWLQKGTTVTIEIPVKDNI